jgi:hypothetical protein
VTTEEREPVREPGDGVTVEEGVNDPIPPADEIDETEDDQDTSD